ncbi:MAG TPA: histidine kinase dimerization/phospho-acceptor domain-containing protein, partial [Myxococcota bacterium]|nr:histidine kinase dimerization/phospho-acceptor domain-containing protein [Myxococcota bacterium]
MPSESHSEAISLWRHPRAALLGWLALGVGVVTTPLIVARDAGWLIAWIDLTLLLLVSIAALKCVATTRRLHGQERAAWLCISVAYALYAGAHLIWISYELALGYQAPVPSLADVGYLTAPPIMMAGIWLYRTSSPTRSTVLVQLGNTGLLVAAIFLANQIVLKRVLVEAPLSPGEIATQIAFGVIATTAFSFALFNICFYMRGRRRLVMLPLLIALGSLAIGDYVSIFEFARDAFTSSSYSMIAYVVTFSLGSWAAFEQDHLARFPAADHDRQAIDRAARQWETLLPVAAIVGLIVVALTHRENLDASLLPDATAALLLFIASIALRDWWSQRVESELREETRTHHALLQRSERRLLEKNQQLIDANRELSAEMIARRNVEEELRHSQKLEAIGQLTGGVAHDFNNLLAVIIGNAELLEQSLATDSQDRCYTQEITAAARRGAALTGRLLAFSRKQALDPRPIEIHRLLESMTGLLERTLGERIQLRFEIAADVAACMIDGAQLENAILNLAINARDAMPDGGSITIEAANVTLTARDVATLPNAAAGDFVAIGVRDTGSGMSEF